MTHTGADNTSQFNRILTRNLAIPLAMGLGSVIVFVGLLWHLVGLLNWVDHTHRVIAKGQELSTLIVDQESGMRGFLIAGEESFLAPYLLGGSRFNAELKGAQELVADNPIQVDRLRRVSALAQRWNEFAQQVIGMRRQGEAVEGTIRQQTGKLLMDEMRRELRAFGDNELRLLRERNEEAQNGTHRSPLLRRLLNTYAGYIAIAPYAKLMTPDPR